ncbi:POTRA domain-containing protein [Paraflavisolibacter sp. H34]|uniref:POTRA domain-containing protein n=1 Tax=Huijunlia imazamoxiresistens TaxID=3127457 RepID=UPI003018E200
MNPQRACFILFLCALCAAFTSRAQIGIVASNVVYSTLDDAAVVDTSSSTLFTIGDIVIEGNKQTRPSIILRELSFYKNDRYSLQVLVDKFNEAKRQLMNTGLFHDVVVSLQGLQGQNATVRIEVKERWYIFPKPFVKTVDRSLGEWITQKDMSMDRVNYGIKLTHKNFTGRRDKFHVGFMNGYTKQLSLSYDGLILDKRMQWTANMGVAMGKNRQVNYMTAENKLVSFKDTADFVHSYFQSYAELTYRPAINTRHTFGLAFSTESVPDTVLAMNPNFYAHKKSVRYPEFYYNLSYYNVDFNPYPTSGVIGEFSFRKKSIDHQLNMWQVGAKGALYKPLGKNYFFSLKAAGMLKLPLKQPYVNQQLLGFNNMYMQGYEYYVVDGVAGGYTKASFSRQLVNTVVHIPSERIKRLNHIPFRLYAKVYGNTGYVYNPDAGRNELNNRLLYSGGVGLDIVTFYDFIIKVEWSFNQLNQNGLYLHRKDYF